MTEFLWLIPIIPLLGSIFNGLLGKRCSEKTVGVIGSGVIGVSFILSAVAFFELLSMPVEERAIINHLYSWLPVGKFQADLSFAFDPLSAVMCLTVSGVSFLIHVYSIGYMHDDKGYYRYFSHLNLFVFFMLTLVLADNMLLMFVGWEGVGLCSYLLIGFWFSEETKAQAGKKAFIVNRIGDFGFILGIMACFGVLGTVNFQEMRHIISGNQLVDPWFSPHHVFAMDALHKTVPLFGAALITIITLSLFLGATGKSAQLPLYVWLPDAMEGPTPVSALIHAATMVTAGVYMVARLNFLFILSPFSMGVVAVVGACTAIYAATIGLTQNDIKRVLAYSTISQLGYMFLAVGVAAFSAGIFHLMTHAFFKALLFMGAGSVMHAMSGELDMRKMGALSKVMPKTFWTFLIATLAIAGCPFLSGFFSKDEILWKAFSSEHGCWILWLVGFLAAGITALYMFRVVFMTFFGKSRVEKETARHLHESPPVMTIPLIILAVLAVIGGYIGIPHVLGGTNRFEHFLEPVFVSGGGHAHHYGEAAEFGLMALSVAIAVVGFLIAYQLYIRKPDMPYRIADRFRRLYKLSLNKYYVDEIYNFLFVRSFKALTNFSWKGVDTALIDEGMVNGSAKFVQWVSSALRRIQTGLVQTYAVVMILGVVILIGYLLMK